MATLSLSIISRFVAPCTILLNKEEIYLNLNLSRELWKDIPIKILKIADNGPWYVTIPFSNFMWNLGNFLLGY